MIKTNAMRLLDARKTAYVPHEYDASVTDGGLVADTLGEPRDHVFKTLVTVSAKGEHLVFVVPVCRELDLKAAARAAGAKSVAMIKQKELEPLTGYVHGGCSPVGMKKRFRTFIDESAVDLATIYVSGGRRGVQMEVSPKALAEVCGATFVPIATDDGAAEE